MIFRKLFELETSTYSNLLGCFRLGNGRPRNEFIAIIQKLKLAYSKYIDRALPVNQSCGLAEAQG